MKKLFLNKKLLTKEILIILFLTCFVFIIYLVFSNYIMHSSKTVVIDDTPFNNSSSNSINPTFSIDKSKSTETNFDGDNIKTLNWINENSLVIWDESKKNNALLYTLSFPENKPKPINMDKYSSGGIFNCYPSGDKIIYTTYSNNSYIYNFKNDNHSKLNKLTYSLQWLPDGNSFISLSNNELFMYDINTNESKSLLSKSELQNLNLTGTFEISKDGSTFYFVAKTNFKEDSIVALNLKDNTLTPICRSNSISKFNIINRDLILFYDANQGLILYNKQTNVATKLASGNITSIALNEDKDIIAYVTYTQKDSSPYKLYIASIKDLPFKPTKSDFKSEVSNLTWSKNNKLAFTVKPSKEKKTIISTYSFK